MVRQGSEEAPKPPKRSNKGALGGAGGGTILVGIGEALGSHTIPGQVVLLAAPAASVGFAVAWEWVAVTLSEWRQEKRIREIKADLEQQLNDPHLTETQRELLRNALDLVLKKRVKEGLQSIGISLGD
jgi:hypothetical protein